jgi:hypothetical protein
MRQRRSRLPQPPRAPKALHEAQLARAIGGDTAGAASTTTSIHIIDGNGGLAN